MHHLLTRPIHLLRDRVRQAEITAWCAFPAS